MSLPSITAFIDTTKQPVAKNITVLQGGDFRFVFDFQGHQFDAYSSVVFTYGPSTQAWGVQVSDTLVLAADQITLEIPATKLAVAGEFRWDLRVTRNGKTEAWAFGEITVRAKAGADDATPTDYNQSPVNYQTTGFVDVALPASTYLVEEVIFYATADTAGLAGTLGTPDDPDALAASVSVAHSPNTTKRVFNKILVGGSLRFTISTGSTGASTGKIIVKGREL